MEMEEQFDAQALMDRISELTAEIRRSDAYPAIVGGIAGGIAGALMAVLIAGRFASRRLAAEGSANASSAKESRRRWSPREIVELATVVASLVKQARQWYLQREKK